MSTDRVGDRGSIGRRILRFLASDRGLLLVSVLLSLSWFAGLLWL
jgi:hypothetical protein